MQIRTLIAMAWTVAAAYGTPKPNQDPPVVDLGYAIHQGQYNDTSGTYHFNNIQYGNVSTPKGRFSAPVPVTEVNRTINDGSSGRKCPQAYPEWSLVAKAKSLNVSTTELFNRTLEDRDLTEDCLFLDVIVPKTICGAGNEGCDGSKKAPVMVWILGGGFVFGDKAEPDYDSSGLIKQSQADGSDGIIFVAINYRLGMFGWLNPPSHKAVTLNCGLYDQQSALHWVLKNIHLFGGDSSRVTVFGESAGGGSIMHQLTAGGGHRKAPFKRAIVQSPGLSTTYDAEGTWNLTLATASKIAGKTVTSVQDLKDLDTKSMIRVNAEVVFKALPGSFGFGPVVDGAFVPDHLGKLLLDGRFDPEPELMVGHNAHEASLFIPDFVDTLNGVLQALGGVTLIGVNKQTLDYILTELYPDPSKTDLYDNQHDRFALLVNEVNFICNTRYLSRAYRGENYNYRFQVPPATHGQDIPYTFYNGDTASDIDTELAVAMQTCFTSFAANGKPACGQDSPAWPRYGLTKYTETFGVDGVQQSEDEAANERCDYWQKGEYLPHE